MGMKAVKILALVLGFCLVTAGSSSAQSRGGLPGGSPTPMFGDKSAFGVVVHTPFHADALKTIGVQWVRLALRWNRIEQGARGSYSWDDCDKLLDYYLGNSFAVMATLTTEDLCPLYESDKNNKDVVIDAIAKWTGTAAERYKGRGILWELGNEPEVFPMGGYWNNPKTYAQMARASATAIKQADPSAKVAAFSVGWFDRDFISVALDTGMLNDGTIDVLTYHGYHRRGMAAESGLAEDVAWLRERIREHAPKDKQVIVADSERGYSILEPFKPKHWSSWRNTTYGETEQAAYAARHFLETIYLGVEIAVWYKDMNGEEGFSLYRGTDQDGSGLRPMGHVFRNLASLFPENPSKLHNSRYTVSLIDPPDSIPAPDGQVTVRTYLQSHFRESECSERLVVAMWYPVEAFDGKILENRKRIGEHFHETWRDIGPDDVVEIPTRVRIVGIESSRVIRMAQYDLLATTTEAAFGEPLAFAAEDGCVISPEIKVGPMPVVLVADLK